MGSESDVPQDWDRIRDLEPTAEPEPQAAADFGHEDLPPQLLLMFGSAWGDLLSVLAVCTSAYLVLALLGYGSDFATMPWALALGILWWAAAAAAMLVIRQGTPGMLLAGVAFDDQVPRDRLPWVIVAALVMGGTLGILTILGTRLSPLRLAAGVDVVPAKDHDSQS
jgi:hypothetical protein